MVRPAGLALAIALTACSHSNSGPTAPVDAGNPYGPVDGPLVGDSTYDLGDVLLFLDGGFPCDCDFAGGSVTLEVDDSSGRPVASPMFTGGSAVACVGPDGGLLPPDSGSSVDAGDVGEAPVCTAWILDLPPGRTIPVVVSAPGFIAQTVDVVLDGGGAPCSCGHAALTVTLASSPPPCAETPCDGGD